jgi:hypothetical protein
MLAFLVLRTTPKNRQHQADSNADKPGQRNCSQHPSACRNHTLRQIRMDMVGKSATTGKAGGLK